MTFKPWVCGFFTVTCAVVLYGLPDPDLFDGRLTFASSASSEAGSRVNKDGGVVENGEGSGSESSSLAADAEAVSANDSVSGSATSTRSFDEFEVGVANATNGPIEVKRSRKPAESPLSASQPLDGNTTASSTQNREENAQKSGIGRQETTEGSGSADYGDNVPFGL